MAALKSRPLAGRHSLILRIPYAIEILIVSIAVSASLLDVLVRRHIGPVTQASSILIEAHIKAVSDGPGKFTGLSFDCVARTHEATHTVSTVCSQSLFHCISAIARTAKHLKISCRRSLSVLRARADVVGAALAEFFLRIAKAVSVR